MTGHKNPSGGPDAFTIARKVVHSPGAEAVSASIMLESVEFVISSKPFLRFGLLARAVTGLPLLVLDS